MSYDDSVAYHGHEAFRPAAQPGRMWPRRAGYGPYSSSALEAARRRTQELYNARRSQLGSPTPSSNSSAFPPSASSSAAVGHQQLWSATSGRPQTGSYVIGPRSVDEADRSYYRPSVAGPSSLPGTAAYQQQHDDASSIYFEVEEPRTATHHTVVVEATIEPHPQQPSTPDVPGGRSIMRSARSIYRHT